MREIPSSFLRILLVFAVPFLLGTNKFLQEDNTTKFDEVLQRVQEVTPLFQELNVQLDRSQFDLNVVGANLNYEAAAIIDFVRKEIAFEQYPGVLRGAQGTLIGYAGNALDKSLLLRRLLDDAGYETRIVRGTLSEEQARQLIDQMALPRPIMHPAFDLPELENAFSQYLQLTGEVFPDQPPTDPYQTYLATTEDDTQLIYDILDEANITFNPDILSDQLIEEAQDYFWIQYRLSAFDSWINVHPAFASYNPTELNITEVYRDNLPEDLYHRFRLEIYIEQKQGDELIVHPLLAGWERTSVELLGNPITFTNYPNNFDFQTATDIDTMLTNTNLFLPLLNNNPISRAFDLNGNPLGIDLAGPGIVGATSLIQTAAGELESITGILDNPATPADNRDDLITLTAEWIEYTLIAPDGSTSTTRRYIMDRIGPENREQGIASIQDDSHILEEAKALLTSHTIMVIPTRYNPTYITARYLDTLLDQAQLLNYLRTNPDLDSLPASLVNQLRPIHDVIYNASFELANANPTEKFSYLSEPLLLIYQDGIVPCPDIIGFERVDIINNARRVFTLEDGHIQPVPLEAIRQGVWETYAERTLIRNSSQPSFNTFDAFHEAETASIPLLILMPSDLDRVNTLAHDEQTHNAVLRDLESGYLVIIPAETTNESGLTGWWRIDPMTGETLGIATGGYGQELVEYLITLVNLGFFVAGTTDCMSNGGAANCCIGSNLGGLLVGAVGGTVVGEFSKLAAILAFDYFWNIYSYTSISIC